MPIVMLCANEERKCDAETRQFRAKVVVYCWL